MDFPNRYLRGQFSSIKQLFITFELTCQNLRFCLFIRKKKVSLSSLIVIGSTGIVVSILFKKVSNVLDAVGIFPANSGPMFVKNLLNSFAMPISLVTSFLLITSLVGRRDPDLFVLPITYSIIYHFF